MNLASVQQRFRPMSVSNTLQKLFTPEVVDFDKQRWASFLDILPQVVLLCTFSWGVLHLLLTRNVKAEIFGIIKEKDKASVHNR